MPLYNGPKYLGRPAQVKTEPAPMALLSRMCPFCSLAQFLLWDP